MVVPDAKSLSMLRVELPAQNGKHETHGFAYSSLSRWSCRRNGEDEELELCFGKQFVKIQGRGLGKLIDALDEGRLKLIRTCSIEGDSSHPRVTALKIESAPREHLNG